MIFCYFFVLLFSLVSFLLFVIVVKDVEFYILLEEIW